MPCLDVSKFAISPKGLGEIRLLVPTPTSSSDMVAVRGGMRYPLACILTCNIKKALQELHCCWHLHQYLIDATMRSIDGRILTLLDFEDDDSFPLGFIFEGQGLASVSAQRQSQRQYFKRHPLGRAWLVIRAA